MKRADMVRLLSENGIEDAENEVFLLVEKFGGLSKTEQIVNPLCDFAQKSLREALELRVQARVPLQYLLGEWSFFRQTYEISSDCLIPQPDTEILVEKAIALLPNGARFADLGTGSGCIAVSVLCERTDTTAVLVDISPAALTLAGRNAQKNGVADRADWLCGDMLSDRFWDEMPPASFDAILSNPPYIRTDVIETLAPEVQKEPRLALDGGVDGLCFYRALCRRGAKFLKPGGFLLVEIGFDQRQSVQTLAGACGWDTESFRDYGGNDRLVLMRPKSV